MSWTRVAGCVSVQKVGDLVRIWRQKEPEGRDRHVSVPESVLRTALENKDKISESKPREEENWRLSKSTFKGIEYLTFGFYDEHLERVG